MCFGIFSELVRELSSLLKKVFTILNYKQNRNDTQKLINNINKEASSDKHNVF